MTKEIKSVEILSVLSLSDLKATKQSKMDCRKKSQNKRTILINAIILQMVILQN